MLWRQFIFSREVDLRLSSTCDNPLDVSRNLIIREAITTESTRLNNGILFITVEGVA
jgi:hypothetical protein